MTHHRIALVLAPLAFSIFAACSSNAQRAATSASTTSASTTAASTSLVTTLVTTTTTVVLSTTAPPVVDTLPPAPEPTDPPAPQPPPTIPPQIAPNPPAECLVADSDHEPVEVVITDDGVLLNGENAPSCMQVPESFRMRFTNNAEGDATVAFGDGEALLAPGDSELSDPLGEMWSVGDHFEIGVAELDTLMDVEVIPA